MTHEAWIVAPEPFDSPDAVALWRECYTHMSDSWYLLRENRRTDPDELEREIAADPGTDFAPPGGALVIARYEGAAAGMAGVRLLDGARVGDARVADARAGNARAELKRVYLRPEFRGKGGAELIVGAAEDEARRLGATRMVLETRSDFVAARALYERLGYDEIEPYTFAQYSEHWYGKDL
ncbi:GNAT family N-acetyltransferase [Promicromonospora panici]|uniref:GNAT family N-acetyltransferase n=1 Tax=Promicromonospora panici TaxID=2219658 RepID=UPI00101D5C09|nr:GNAT family N-acetyltransferase [Promicromonospora panici]